MCVCTQNHPAQLSPDNNSVRWLCVCVSVCVCWLSSFEVWGKLENMEVLLINVLLADSIRKQQIILNDLVRRIRKK